MDAKRYEVRRAVEDDRLALRDLASELSTSFPVQPGACDDLFARALTDPGQLLVVAESTDDRRLLGYLHAIALPAFHANGEIVWVQEVFTVDTHRRSGIGRSLMTSVETWARDERHAPYVSLATRRAAAFYERIGYEHSAIFYRKLL